MMLDGTVIDIGDLPESVRSWSEDMTGQDEILISVQELQERHVRRVLEHVNGNKSQAAEILGISRATIYQLLEKTKAKSGMNTRQSGS